MVRLLHARGPCGDRIAPCRLGQPWPLTCSRSEVPALTARGATTDRPLLSMLRRTPPYVGSPAPDSSSPTASSLAFCTEIDAA